MMGGLFCYPAEKSYTLNNRKYTVSRLLGEGGFSFTGNREISIFKKFDHPNILRLIDHATIKSKTVPDAQEILILMPFIKDGTLQDILDRQRTVHGKECTTSVFNQRQSLTMFRQICEGIAQFHHSDPPLAHRDIKPGNVLLADSNNNNNNNNSSNSSSSSNKIPILMDFGSTGPARLTVTSRKQALEIQEDADQHSTPLYRAPELFDVSSDCQLDERTDIWALGCLLYSMAFNKSPFESSSEDKSGSIALSVISGQFEIPKSHSFSKELIDLIRSMLQLNIQDRPSIDHTQKTKKKKTVKSSTLANNNNR
ncbi:putative protein serine/threonine kinase [Heterostelium album PN500]|uniref:non-specific serine/threonine protein kinase n=1 Tax=Heterostelium pallidum (strain ATCC 26659 / Pp 5 / PN500) TaxID=670386 RepID=D3B6S0_HETP5|nr:putative protein serine/threonine kinase [Heterostelium album PN500]EFA83040.1 putative protein serine/threonine kinase [Heterostelium album PN500]|eukprot:XP_020435157.1 putative protein serine/threonine kinase [Heterostelium album PN500]